MNVSKTTTNSNTYSDNINPIPETAIELGQEKPFVYLGEIYHDIQQYSHFEEYYFLYKNLPPLVLYPNTMSRRQTQSSTDVRKNSSIIKTTQAAAIKSTKASPVSYTIAQSSQNNRVPSSHMSSSPSLIYNKIAGDQKTHMAYQTRVGAVPSFAPKNQSLRNIHMGTTTLALKLEPSIPSKISYTQSPYNISIFSGPHYQPEKYSVKTSTDLRNRFLLPEQFSTTNNISESRHLLPSVDHYFQNALIDGSYFESYSDYNAEDPENFRHAFGVKNDESPCMGITRMQIESDQLNQLNQNRDSPPEISLLEPSQEQQQEQQQQQKERQITQTNQQYASLKPTKNEEQDITYQLQQKPVAQVDQPSTSKAECNIEKNKAHQNERVNQILEAANLLDFSGHIALTTNNEPPKIDKPMNRYGPNTIPRVIPSRRWHRQNSDSTDSETDESSDDEENEKEYNAYERESSLKRDRKGKEKVSEKPESPPAYRPMIQSHKPHRGSIRTAGKTIAHLPSASASTSYTDEIDSGNDNMSLVVSSSPVSSSPPVDSGNSSSSSSSFEDSDSDEPMMKLLEKRQKLEVIEADRLEKPVPTKAVTVIKCRDWGRFLQSWRIKRRPLVCSICLDQVVSSEASSVVYCDSPQCDVLIHRACLNRKELPILVQKCWLCDKCFFLDTLEQDVRFVVTCALCPNTNGLFCKLSPYLHDIPWIHFTCAKMLEGNPGDFSYQPDLGEYEARIDLIPLDKFNKTCAFCEDAIFAEYGAKLTCSDCEKSFHVTCAQMNGVHVSLESGKAKCLNHFKQDMVAQQLQSSRDYKDWIELKEAYLLKHFSKNSRMFAIDSWKALAKDPSSFSVGNKDINSLYKFFLHRMKSMHYEVEGTTFSQWINYTLAYFNSVYSARDMETYIVSFSAELFSSHKLNWKHYNFQAGIYETTSQFTVIDEGKINQYGGSDEEMGNISRKRIRTEDDLIEIINPSSSLLTPPHLKSPNQICYICQRTKLPPEVCASLGVSEDYLKELATTAKRRPPGFTGKGYFWDPRVLIQCSKCLSILHCGCPETPIKNYPEKNKVFVCIRCDRKDEIIAATQGSGPSRRSRKVNYKE